MSTRNFALIAGIVMLLVGTLSLIPGLNSSARHLPLLYVDDSYGVFLNIFPMNIFNKAALIFFGLLGISCYFVTESSFKMSQLFSRILFWIMGALAIFGLFPETNTLSGYWPLFGPEIFFHGSFAVMGLYFGYLAMREDTSMRYRRPHKMHKI